MTLPDAARFAREIGRLSVSVQLWSAGSVFDVTATACTDKYCKPGGRPQKQDYRLEFAVYRRQTGALVCSTSAPGTERCPGVPRSWNRARLAPGRSAELVVQILPPYDQIFAMVNNQQYDYTIGSPIVFREARIGAEFGTDPFVHEPYRVPRKAVALASFGIPPAPPFAAELAAGSHASCFTSARWQDHRVRRTGISPRSRAEALPGRLSYYGCDFTTYLEP